jgi:hypothetical protein
MDILVLQGLPNKGKTTTIGLVYDLVINSGGVSTKRQTLGGDPKDFSDIVTGFKNKEIAFFSMGDNSTELALAIYNYNRQNCDLIICALSTGTAKVRANNAINKFNATRFNKRIAANPSLENQANVIDASIIFYTI